MVMQLPWFALVWSHAHKQTHRQTASAEDITKLNIGASGVDSVNTSDPIISAAAIRRAKNEGETGFLDVQTTAPTPSPTQIPNTGPSTCNHDGITGTECYEWAVKVEALMVGACYNADAVRTTRLRQQLQETTTPTTTSGGSGTSCSATEHFATSIAAGRTECEADNSTGGCWLDAGACKNATKNLNCTVNSQDTWYTCACIDATECATECTTTECTRSGICAPGHN